MSVYVYDSKPWWASVPEMHRNLFRGKSLGSTFTNAQKAAIVAGTWDDLYLGDYWTINDHTWRIADFDYWLGKGETSCTKHHIVVVPDSQLYVAAMNATDTTEGGYYNSDMRQKHLAQAKGMIEADLGAGSILKHRIYLTDATTENGYPSSRNWYDSDVDLMNEFMVYGAAHFRPDGSGITSPSILSNHTTEYTQLALFRLAPYYIQPNRQWYWLRDVVSKFNYAVVSGQGHSGTSGAAYERAVRPAFGIVGSPQSADEPIEVPEIMNMEALGGDRDEDVR